MVVELVAVLSTVNFGVPVTVVVALEQLSPEGQLPPLYVGVVVPSLFTEA